MHINATIVGSYAPFYEASRGKLDNYIILILSLPCLNITLTN